MAVKKYSDNDITSLDDNWGMDPKDGNLPFSGDAVQKFVRNELKGKVGYTSLEMIDEEPYLYMFNSLANYEKWVSDKETHSELVIDSVKLPAGGAATLDVYSVSLEKPDDDDLEIITTASKVYLRVRANSKVKRAGSDSLTQLKETGTLTISTAAGTSNSFTRRRSMSLSSIDNEADDNNYTSIDVSDYITKDTVVRVRLAWRGSESQLTRQITFTIDQSTFGLNFATEYQNPFSVGSDIILNFDTTGSISKTLYVKILSAGYTEQTDHLDIGDQVYTHKYENLVGNVRPSINIGQLGEGLYNGQYWVCTDTVKSEVKTFQFLVSDEENGIELVINNVNNSISNWAMNDIFEYAFCGASSTNLKFVFWNDNYTSIYEEVSQASVTPKAKHMLSTQIEFNITDAATTAVTANVRVYVDNGQTITSNTPHIGQQQIMVNTAENFAPTVMANGFILDPKARSNSNSDKETIYNGLNGSTISGVTWSNMDWLNGGWTTDESGNKCLRLLAGSKVTIPYKVFDTASNHNTLHYGATIEVDYAFRNVSDDTEPVVNMSTKLSRTQPYGFIMYPNIAYVYTNNLTDTLNQDTEYQEDTRTHFTVNVKYQHTLNINGTDYRANFIRTYVNGTINREFTYSEDDTMNTNMEKIVIGSDFADVDIYGIRIYEDAALSTQEIQQDFMSSLPSFADKKAYKDANNICNADGTINYDMAKNKYRTIKFTGRYPEYMNKANSEGTLTVTYLRDTKDEYGNYEVDTDNSCIIENMSAKGQGSTSKLYYKWNCTWKFEDNTVYKDINGNVINDHAYWQYVTRDDEDNIVAITPRASKLVGKLNYASSMQSHKQGSLRMYEDIRKQRGFRSEIQKLGGSDIEGSQYHEQRFDLSRLALRQDEFLFFVEYNGETKFYGLMTWGAAKGDKLTYGYDKNVSGSKDMLMLGGSNQTNPLTLCHAPWISDDVTTATDDEGKIETWNYNGEEAFDNELGNVKSIVYFRDYHNFVFVNSYRLLPYTGSNIQNETGNSLDTTYQYWDDSYNVWRYNFLTGGWIGAGVEITEQGADYTASKTYSTSLNLLEYLNNVAVTDPNGNNIVIGSVDLSSYSKDELNTIFKRARATNLREHIDEYASINEILNCFSFTLLIAASDNLCKNSFFMVDKPASGKKPKILPWRDDDDTIFRVNNEGTKDKNYYVEFFDKKADGTTPFFTANNTGYYGTLLYAYLTDLEERDATTSPSLRGSMSQMLDAMSTLGSGYEINGDTVLGCFNRYYFSIQKYLPSVAYNETARLLYEEAALLGNAGIDAYDAAKNSRPITMSMGDSLQGEIQFLKMRTFFMKTFAMYYKSLGKFGFKLADDSNKDLTVRAGAEMYAFAMHGEDQTGTNHPVRMHIGDTHTFQLGGGQTVTTSIVGTEYLSSVGSWVNKHIYDNDSSILLYSNRTKEFDGGDATASNVKFNPKTLTDASFPLIIEDIDLENVVSLQGVANMTNYKRLKTLKLNGTSITNVQLPMTNTLTSVTIPTGIHSITLRQAPNFNDSSLSLETRSELTTINIYTDGDATHDFYGTDFDWVQTWLNNLSPSINKADEVRLFIEGVNWTLPLTKVTELANIKLGIREMDLSGRIALTGDEFDETVIDQIKAAFGDDAFNPANRLVFVIPFTYEDILYSQSSKDGGTSWSKMSNETNNGSDLVEGWSNEYSFYTVNRNITSVTWSVDNNKVTLSNQSNSGVTASCTYPLASAETATITAAFTFTTEVDGQTISGSGTKTRNITLAMRTYPEDIDGYITGDDLLNELNTYHVYRLNFEKPFYTGNYTVTWEIDGSDAIISASGQSQCTLYTTTNNPQAMTNVLKATLTYEDGRGSVIVTRNILIGQELYGKFGDVLLDDMTFARPTYTYNASGYTTAVSVTIPTGRVPIGITVVPRTHTKDRTARVMSLKGMHYDNPEVGGDNQGMYWGGYNVNINSLPDLTKVPTISGSTVPTNDYTRLGSEEQYNGNFKYKNSGVTDSFIQDNLWYYLDTSSGATEPLAERMCPSPFKGSAPFSGETLEQNEAYVMAGTATADFNGKKNTDIITAMATSQSDWTTASAITNSYNSGYYPAACCCRRFHTTGTNAGDWYLPACGELGYIIPKLAVINRIVSAINTAYGSGTAFALYTDYNYWSSSEYSAPYARYVYTLNGLVTYNLKNYSSSVRAFLAV